MSNVAAIVICFNFPHRFKSLWFDMKVLKQIEIVIWNLQLAQVM